MKHLLPFLTAFALTNAAAQQDTSAAFLQRKAADTSSLNTRQDAIFNRPFITMGQTSTAVGGYVEGNTNYFVTDGVTDGFSMELRRFNIFLYSSIAQRIKFLSELEFEHGTEEISLETAVLDLTFHPAFNVRGGILLPPLGGVNPRHDSPLWEFVERPLVSTEIIPSTLSEVGFGVYGKLYGENQVFTYDFYLVNGLQEGLAENDQNRTFLQAGKSEEAFGEDNNGSPAVTGKVAFRHRRWGEVGVSGYWCIYNKFREEGLRIDKKRSLSLWALDFTAKPFRRLTMNGEFALANIEVFENAGQFYGKRQWGGYVEAIFLVLQRKLLRFENSQLNLNLRVERIDYNAGKFEETGDSIGDEVDAIAAGISFRPVQSTVLRANFRYHWTKDLLGNPPVKTAGIQVGFASYF